MLQFPRKEEGKREKEKGRGRKKRKGTRKRKRRTKKGRKKKKQGEEEGGIVFGSIVGGKIRITDRSVLQKNCV